MYYKPCTLVCYIQGFKLGLYAAYGLCSRQFVFSVTWCVSPTILSCLNVNDIKVDMIQLFACSSLVHCSTIEKQKLLVSTFEENFKAETILLLLLSEPIVYVLKLEE
ncbi:unnamed protein product [Ilex paraguariensis]|uniref:Uncharacterized protein n=1 Tax=Ilex paraguariensis TaxID=185542 RepID=A0ABC8RD34_9AQUA